ncbi:MAG: hypothetical protein ACXU8U_07210 [Asticcacaulis sp.]
MFRLLIKTTTRMIESRGLRQTSQFINEYLRSAPWSDRWTAFIDGFCRRHLGSPAPLDLIQAGVWRAGARRFNRLRAHYEILGAYLSAPVLGRLVLGRTVQIASLEAGAMHYRLDLSSPPSLRARGELMLALTRAGAAEPAAWLSLRFGWSGPHRIALRIGRSGKGGGVDEIERDLHGLPASSVLMDGVYAMVRTLGVMEVTAESGGEDRFFSDCGGLLMPAQGRFELPLQPVFWCSGAGRAALGEAWVPQQMLRMGLMSQANAQVASWLRFDETRLAHGSRSRALESNEN